MKIWSKGLAIAEEKQKLKGKVNTMEHDWTDYFYSKPLTESQGEDWLRVRAAFAELAKTLQDTLPPSGESGRYRSLVKTNLEQAAMWASKSIAWTSWQTSNTTESVTDNQRV